MNRDITSVTIPPFVSVVALLVASVLPSRSAAQQYAVTELPGLGGSMSLAESINNRSWVSGWSNLSGDQNEHAFLWIAGQLKDLGTLGGPSSSVGSPVHNERGELAGSSDTSEIDPLGEDFCGFGTPYICRGFVWRDGRMTSLPTLGGNNSYGNSVNNWGLIVGEAETNVQDPNCVPPQVFDFEAVIWGPHPNEIRALPPLPGDSIAAALAINDVGQVAGGSGSCGPIQFQTSAHAVLWENGKVINLGSLGGAFNNLALDMNELGEVAGISDLPGDTTSHGFLWKDGHMIDLGTLPGDNLSYAFGINNRGQVVGQSCDPSGNCRAFLWQNGVMTDLNSLITPSSSLYLIIAISINDLGEIVGQAFDSNTGNLPAYLATQTHKQGASNVSQKLLLPPQVRERLLQQRALGSFRVGLIMPH
jgi:probable HAF family extracellular repeat protein